MSRPFPASDPCAGYLAAERAWLAHMEACAACRSSRTGRPRCDDGAAVWNAMNDAQDELEAAMDAAAQLVSPF